MTLMRLVTADFRDIHHDVSSCLDCSSGKVHPVPIRLQTCVIVRFACLFACES